MTEDYSLADIRSLLKREGCRLEGAEISVVLTRMRRSREIEEIERSHGPISARFRGPAGAIDETEPTVAATAAA